MHCLCCVLQLDPQTVQSKNWHMDVIEMNGVRHTFCKYGNEMCYVWQRQC